MLVLAFCGFYMITQPLIVLMFGLLVCIFVYQVRSVMISAKCTAANDVIWPWTQSSTTVNAVDKTLLILVAIELIDIILYSVLIDIHCPRGGFQQHDDYFVSYGSCRPIYNVFFSGPRVRIPAMPLFYWVATLGKLFTRIAFPVFSALKTGVQKGVFGLDRFNGLTGWVR